MSTEPTPTIMSFSGIDGAGKSTQITALTSLLQSLGRRTKRLTFWDDVVVFSRYREYAGHKAKPRPYNRVVVPAATIR